MTKKVKYLCVKVQRSGSCGEFSYILVNGKDEPKKLSDFQMRVALENKKYDVMNLKLEGNTIIRNEEINKAEQALMTLLSCIYKYRYDSNDSYDDDAEYLIEDFERELYNYFDF